MSILSVSRSVLNPVRKISLGRLIGHSLVVGFLACIKGTEAGRVSCSGRARSGLWREWGRRRRGSDAGDDSEASGMDGSVVAIAEETGKRWWTRVGVECDENQESGSERARWYMRRRGGNWRRRWPERPTSSFLPSPCSSLRN